MTPEKHKDIQIFVDKLTAFLEKVAEEHEDFDIKSVNVEIEGCPENDTEEKNTVLQVTINDCATIAEKEAEEDRKELEYKEEIKKELQEEEDKQKETEDNCEECKTIDCHEAIEDHEEISNCESNGHEKPRAVPTLVHLNLSANGQEIIKILEKKRGKRPIVVVMEQDNGTRRMFIPDI